MEGEQQEKRVVENCTVCGGTGENWDKSMCLECNRTGYKGGVITLPETKK